MHLFYQASKMLLVKPQPKHVRLRQQLAQQVRAGVFGPEGQLPSERELMREHGMSYSTVTRAIKDLEHAGLIRRVWGKGTFVAPPSESQANQLAITFGTLYEISHPAVSQVQAGIEESLSAANLSKPWHLQLFPTNGFLAPTESSGGSATLLLAQLVEERRIHGLIMLTPMSIEEVLWLERHNVPMVSINFHYPGTAVQSISEDSASAAWQVAEHVASLNVDRVALVMGPMPDRSRRLVRSSWVYATNLKQELAQRNIACESRYTWHGDYHWPQALATLQSWLDDPKAPSLWIFRDDVMARQALQWVKAQGRSVPKDLKIIGFSDLYWQEGQITSVSLGLPEYGRLAMQWLDRAVQGNSDATRRTILKTELIVRQSTDSHVAIGP